MVLKVFEDEAGCPEVGALDDIKNIDDIWMFEALQDVILSLYFAGLHGKEYFDCNFFLGFGVLSLEYMWIFATSNLMRNGVALELSE